MTDKRRGGRRKSDEDSRKLTKEEDAVARYVRFNCPTKTTMFEGNEVHYFSGSKAVDTLFESKKYGHLAKTVKFANRASAITFLRTMLEKGLFFRARKLVAKKKAGATEEEEDKKKRKVKLELHQDQAFNDASDVYVWIFDPTPLKKKIIGALMLLGTIAGCLFSLWPIWLRQLVYYLSLVGICCFGLLFGVAVARTILYWVIWAVTMGRHNLWILPNLTEDCGFFESFQPWYTYEYLPTGKPDKKKKEDESKKEKDDGKGTESERTGGEEEKERLISANEGSQRSDGEAKGEPKDGEGSAGSEEGSASEENDEDRSQTSDSTADGDGGKPEGEKREVRRRRRPRKDEDDDFVLVEKQVEKQ